MTLDAFLDHMMYLQPFSLYLRLLVPLLMMQIGKDEDAYCFIKFWVKNTPCKGKLRDHSYIMIVGKY